eukprot:scaffold144499_cov40-Tisochrysis_lutea.AAC.1
MGRFSEGIGETTLRVGDLSGLEGVGGVVAAAGATQRGEHGTEGGRRKTGEVCIVVRCSLRRASAAGRRGAIFEKPWAGFFSLHTPCIKPVTEYFSSLLPKRTKVTNARIPYNSWYSLPAAINKNVQWREGERQRVQKITMNRPWGKREKSERPRSFHRFARSGAPVKI